MGTNRWQGAAPAVAQVTHVTPGTVETGDVFTLTINSNSISYTAADSTVADVVDGLVDAWNNSTIPEFAEITASAGTDSDGNKTHVVLTADTAGKPFTVTASTTNTSQGTVTVTEDTAGSTGLNEIQKVELLGSPTGGTFNLQWDSGSGTESASNIAYDATAQDVEDAMVSGMASVSAGDVSVSGSDGGPWLVQFKGTYANTDANLIAVDGTSLTGNGEINVTTTTKGFPAGDRIVLFQTKATDGTWTITVNGETSTFLNWNDSPSTVQSAIESLSGVTSGDVEVLGGVNESPTGASNTQFTGAWLIHFKGQLAGEEVGVTVEDNGLDTTSNVFTELTFGNEDPADEIQFINLGGASSGTWAVSHNGNRVSDMNWDTLKGTVEDQINGANSITDPGVKVYQAPPGIGFFVHFKFNEAGVDQPKMDLHDFTNGTSTGIDVVQDGGSGTNEVQEVEVSGSGGTFTLTFDGQTTSDISYGATASTLETELESLSNITNVTVSGTGTPSDPYVVTFVDPGSQDVAEMTGDATNLSGGDGRVTVTQSATSPTDEIQDVVLDSSVTSGDFTLTFGGEETDAIAYNASASTFKSKLEALATIDGVSVSSITDGWQITFDGTNVSGRNLDLLTADGSGLVGGSGSETLSVSEDTASCGPNDWNCAENWSLKAVPVNGDDVVFDTGDSDCLYGLDQNSVTLNSLRIKKGWEGKLGLPEVNEDDSDNTYYEYRQKYLKIGVNPGLIEIGEGDVEASDNEDFFASQTGSSTSQSRRIRIDTQAVQTTMVLHDTGEPLNDSVPTVLWIGTHSSNAIHCNKGSLGIAFYAGESATVATLQVGWKSDQDEDSDVTCGDGASLTTINQSGGSVQTNSAVSTLSITAGSYVHNEGTLGTLNGDGGTIVYLSTGTITTAKVGGSCTLDFTQDMRSRTVTTTELHEGGSIKDPFGTVTWSNGIDLIRAGLDEVTLDLGQHWNLAKSAV